jgi:hypothetical protein
MLRSIGNKIWCWLVRGGHEWTLALYYRWVVIKERFADGSSSLVLWPARHGKKLKILALGAEGFRGDLELLAGTGKFQVITISRRWQTRLIKCFYGPILQGDSLRSVRHHRADGNSIDLVDQEFLEAKRAAQKFFERFLSVLYKSFPIDIVLVYNVRYLADLDWAQVSKKFGILYLMIFRELPNFLPKYDDLTKYRHGLYGQYKGDHIIVGNEKTRGTFVQPGFATASQVTACGILRMDSLLKRIEADKKVEDWTPKVTLVWWSIGLYESEEFLRLTAEVLDAFIELSMELPDVEFLIKPKSLNVRATKFMEKKGRQNRGPEAETPKGGNKQLALEEELKSRRPKWSEKTNLKIDPWVNMHDVIFVSSVICGFQSLSLVEAALAGKPVVVPYFDYFSASSEAEDYQFKQHLKVCDVAGNKTQFKDLIKARLDAPSIEPTVQQIRRAHFIEHVADISESSVEKTTNLIVKLAKEKSVQGEFRD